MDYLDHNKEDWRKYSQKKKLWILLVKFFPLATRENVTPLGKSTGF